MTFDYVLGAIVTAGILREPVLLLLLVDADYAVEDPLERPQDRTGDVALAREDLGHVAAERLGQQHDDEAEDDDLSPAYEGHSALLVAFGGVTDRLIPLFAIGAFGAFTLSQSGMVVHWRRSNAGEGGASDHRASMAINAFGAVSTGVVLLVILVTKFLEGAWIVLILVPALHWLFVRVERHYAVVREQTDCDAPLTASDIRQPVVVVVMRRWSTITRNALRFAMSMSDEVVAVHVTSDAEEGRHLACKWNRYVKRPLMDEDCAMPRLVFVDSPYRLFLDPLFDTLQGIGADHPDRTIAVVVPELAGGRWYDYFLHNQRSTALKAAILLRGDGRVVLVNVPWRLADRSSKML